MESSSTSSVYIQVIEDVINKVREEFNNNNDGPDEDVLHKLQIKWEMKMMTVGAIMVPIYRSAANTLHDLYETPTDDLLIPHQLSVLNILLQVDAYAILRARFFTPMQTSWTAQTPLTGRAPTLLPGAVDSSYNIPTNDYLPVDENEASWSNFGRPTSYMDGAFLANHSVLPRHHFLLIRFFMLVSYVIDDYKLAQQPPPSWPNTIAAYEEGLEEADRIVAQAHQPITQDVLHLFSGKRKRDDFPSQHRSGGYIPQQNGAGDVIAGKSEAYTYQGAVNEDYNVANTPEIQAPTPASVNPNDDDEDEPLNEKDDDDEDEPLNEKDDEDEDEDEPLNEIDDDDDKG